MDTNYTFEVNGNNDITFTLDEIADGYAHENDYLEKDE